MTFLAPLAGIIGACLAVPSLLVLYFLRLRRRPVRVSSTFLWAQAVQDLQVNVPFKWIRPSWLLLLHLLILTLLLMALARPAIRSEGGPASRVFILIDRSASMSAIDGGEQELTRLDAAKDAAREVVRQIGRSGTGARAMVVSFAAQAQAITPLSSDTGMLRRAIDLIEPSDQPGDLRSALRLVQGLVASGGAAGEDEPQSTAEVVILSDGSFADETSPSLAGAEVRYERIGPEANAARDNVGIVALTAKRDLDDPTLVRVFARVQSARAEATRVPLTVQFNGEVARRVALDVPGLSEDGTPGQTATTVELTLAEAGLILMSIGERDALESDNFAGVALAAASRPRIVLVAPDGEEAASGDEGVARRLLRGTLEQMRVAEMRLMSRSTYARLAPEVSQRYDMIVFDRVRPAETPTLPTLSLGAGLPIAGLSLPGAVLEPTYVLSWKRSDPLLRYVALDSIYIAQPMRISLPATGSQPGLISEELARGSGGTLIARIGLGGVEHVVVAFDLVQSNWAVHVGFPIFLDNVITRLATGSGGPARAAMTTGKPSLLRVIPTATSLTLDGPVSFEALVPSADVGENGGMRTVSLGLVERIGVYRVSGGMAADGSAPEPVAINLLDETESALGTQDSLVISGKETGEGAGTLGIRELWQWFVLAAGVLLMLEWLVYGWKMRVR